MTSAAIAAAYEHANAQVTDWLDAEELVDIAAEVDDTLAPPEPEAVPLADEDEFHEAHFRQDPAYRKRAAEAFATMEARRTAALAEADAKHNIETKILTPSSVDDLIATHVTHLGYPPAFGWENAEELTMRALGRFGMLDARQSGKAGLLFRYNDDRHSANKPSKEENGVVDSSSVGCSADHDAAHHQFWIDFLTWRVHNVYGESTFSSGDSLVRPSWLNALLSLQTREIPRSWPAWEKYKELAGPETDGSVTLLASAELDPAAVFPPGDDNSAYDDAADCFTHYTSCISDLSSALHAATPDPSSCGQLGRIQQIERTYEEARLVLDDCSVKPEDAAYLSRVYIARCRTLAAGVTVPPEIKWALERQLASDGEQLDLETAAGSTRQITERLSEFAEKWEASGRGQIGRSVDPQGLVAMAIAGWKLSLQKTLERQPHCPLSSVDSTSPICTPALGAAQLGVAAYREQQQQRVAAGRLVVQALPLTARGSTSAISTPAISSASGTAIC